jgi:hypothetical protein
MMEQPKDGTRIQKVGAPRGKENRILSILWKTRPECASWLMSERLVYGHRLFERRLVFMKILIVQRYQRFL